MADPKDNVVPSGVVIPRTWSTARLSMEALGPENSDAWHDALMQSWPELSRMLRWAHTERTREQSLDHAQKAAKSFSDGTDIVWAIRSDEIDPSGGVLGGIGLHRILWRVPLFDIGYWIRSDVAGRGVATEAARGVCDLAIRSLGARRVSIGMRTDNEGSRRIAERLVESHGFVFEGIERHADRHHDGTLVDHRNYALSIPDPA